MRRPSLLVLAAALAAAAAVAAPAALAAPAQAPLQSREWFLHAVGADQATPPGPGVPITIVDSGVDASQPEFAGRPDTTYLNAQTTGGGDEAHGTAVASVAAAPGVGILGVYPQAALQIWDASPGGQLSNFAAIQGIQAAAQHCPGVISLSWGETDGDPLLQQALLQAQHDGCLVVAAAGNEADQGNPTIYPAAYPHVLTVGGVDEQDQPLSFSSFGPWVDLAAPGKDILAAVPTSADPSGYMLVDGTSFAAPIVSAAAAWVWTVRPKLTASQVFALLRSSARDVAAPGVDMQTGHGVVDIPAALTAPTPPPDPDEPNDDVDQVKPGALFPDGEPPLTTAARPSNRIAGTLDAVKDPRDVYRIWVPAHRTVRVSVASDGSAAARIWGPQTISTREGLAARRRDLKGQQVRAGKRGFAAYVEVLPTGRSDTARYVLSVRASRR